MHCVGTCGLDIDCRRLNKAAQGAHCEGAHGVQVSSEGRGIAPLHVHPQTLHGTQSALAFCPANPPRALAERCPQRGA